MKIRFKRVYGLWNPGDIAESMDDNVARLLIERHVAEKVEDGPPKPQKKRSKKK